MTFDLIYLSKPHGSETFSSFCKLVNFLIGWLTHKIHKHGLNGIFFYAWVKQNDVLVISSLMYILHIWSMFGIFISEIHESLMCVSWLLKREKPCSFQVSCCFLSHILRGSFYYSWSWFIFMHFPIPHMFWWVLLSVSGNMIHFVNLWQKGGVKIGEWQMTHPIDFVTKLLKRVFVSSYWGNSVRKIVIKSTVVQTRRKAVWTLKEFYFSREPRLQSRLQACQNKLDKQEFPRDSSVVSSELRPDT